MTTDQNLIPLRSTRSAPVAFGAGAAIGVLGGMIGLGGAEFRLPLLIGLFGFAALSAVILNKTMSLIVVLVALPARLAAVPAAEVAARWPVAVNLLAGSLLGAWAGASWAVRMRTATLYKVLAALMVLMAASLVVTHTTTLDTLALPLWAQIPAGVVAGFGIGVVAAIMGVAGGELLIPTIVLLFGEDIKTAGSLSLLVSLPTMLVAFARYSRDGSFAVLSANRRFTLIMAAGSVAGAVLGGLLLGLFPDLVIIPALAVILLVSAVKLARHDCPPPDAETIDSARTRCPRSRIPQGRNTGSSPVMILRANEAGLGLEEIRAMVAQHLSAPSSRRPEANSKRLEGALNATTTTSPPAPSPARDCPPNGWNGADTSTARSAQRVDQAIPRLPRERMRRRVARGDAHLEDRAVMFASQPV
ncbi:sulfite exporter TauE/SafE family protein [Streptomyces cinereoruber]|uniref:sulfite exporter TauE/SafE family protein n=1 Tax=Streptomyces cinereoruber TaxID=67260 RepID=UPI003BF5A705